MTTIVAISSVRSVADPEGGAAAAPPSLVQSPQNKKGPYFGQNMLQNASFEAYGFHFFPGEHAAGPL